MAAQQLHQNWEEREEHGIRMMVWAAAGGPIDRQAVFKGREGRWRQRRNERKKKGRKAAPGRRPRKNDQQVTRTGPLPLPAICIDGHTQCALTSNA